MRHTEVMARRVPLPCRRLSDRLLEAFHLACDEGEPDVARAVLALLITYAESPPDLPPEGERRVQLTFQGPYERLQNLLLHTGQMPWDDAPGHRPLTE
jgi:hypothetical protein